MHSLDETIIRYDIITESLDIEFNKNDAILSTCILLESDNTDTVVEKQHNILKEFVRIVIEKIQKLIDFIKSKFNKDRMDVISNISKENPRATITVSKDPNVVIQAANESIKEIETAISKQKKGIFRKEDGSINVSKVIYTAVGAATATTIGIIVVPKLINTINGLLGKLKNLGKDVMTNIDQDKNSFNKAKSKTPAKTSLASKVVYNVGKGIGFSVGNTVKTSVTTAANRGFVPTFNISLNLPDPKMYQQQMQAQNEIVKAISNTTKVLETTLNKDLLNNPDINKVANEVSDDKSNINDKQMSHQNNQ